MNKNQLRRYKKIGVEITQLNQDLEDLQEWLDECYVKRDFEGAASTLKLITNTYHEIGVRRVIRDELLLPQSKELKGAMKTIEKHIGEECKMVEGKWELTDYGMGFIEEFIASCLEDDYNHNIVTFEWSIEGSNIYVENIRWNQHQLLKSDLIDLLNGKLDRIEVGDIVLIKNTNMGEGVICLYDKEEPNYENYSLRATIQWLERHYYL